MEILTNPTTGVEFDNLTGDSIKRFVAAESNGVVRDTRGEKWPAGDGFVHKQPYEYFEIVPFAGVEYDAQKFYVKTGQILERFVPSPPTGHPQGIFKTVQTLHLLPKADLKNNALEHFNQAQTRVWPQDPSYDKVLSIAQKALNSSGSSNPEIGTPEFYAEIVEKDQRIEAALISNRLRLEELNREIDALQVDENGDLELNASGQVITSPNSIDFARMLTADESGWVDGVA
jgi:hypothetical protein